MENPEETFIPRKTSGPSLSGIGGFLDRSLTMISLAVLLIGLLAVGLGPVRLLLTQMSDNRLTGNDGAITAAQIEAGVASANPNQISSGVRLERELMPFTTIPDRPRNEVTTYTILPGDSLFGLAFAFNLDPNTIFWSNSETLGDSVHTILPGIDLFILPVNGIYHRSDGITSIAAIAQNYLADAADIINFPANNLLEADPSAAPAWGTRVVVPGGEREIIDWRPPIVETTSASGRVSRSFMPGMAGSCAALNGGGGTGAWIPPLGAYTVTTPYYPGHSGIDLAAPLGASVQAADTGVVIFSGWVLADWGYGILVVLDHGNGWTSYYAHMSSTGVGCGQTVGRGGYLGGVGSTGNSSGPHLHFEMRWNHTPDNPAAYIGF